MPRQTLLTAIPGQPTRRRTATVITLPTRRRSPIPRPARYADLADRHLADTLAAEDVAVETGLSPFDRLTCPAHRRWIHQCIASPQHVSPVTGHRWCYDCHTALTVAIDELDATVTITCPRCHRTPTTLATRQLLHAAHTSLTTHRHHRTAARVLPLHRNLPGRAG